MLRNKELKFGSTKISVHPMKPMKAVRITKTILELLGKGISGDTSKKQILTAIADGLTSMEDEKFVEFSTYIYSDCQVIKPSKEPFTIVNEETMNDTFEGVDIENMFIGIFEILKFNRFPFLREVEVDFGELMTEIGHSVKEDLSVEKSVPDTENQENSPKS